MKIEPVLRYIDLGLIEYKEAWEYQEKVFKTIVDYKRSDQNGKPPENYLLFCEHPHVYTLGKSGSETNLLIQKEFLDKIEATYFRTDRGGDITYHGPGQIVGYPVIDLEQFGLGLKRYIELLEESIITLLENYGLSSSRMNGATGVWLDSDHPVKARKICAIGVKSSRFVTMHGFALNVNTNLDYFTYINPCGLEIKGVTSMQKELGKLQNYDKIKEELRDIIRTNFLAQEN